MKPIVKQKLPKEEIDLIIKALNFYRKALHATGVETDEINYMKHDCYTLASMLKDNKVTVKMPMLTYETFTHVYAVDYPMYCEGTTKEEDFYNE